MRTSPCSPAAPPQEESKRDRPEVRGLFRRACRPRSYALTLPQCCDYNAKSAFATCGHAAELALDSNVPEGDIAAIRGTGVTEHWIGLPHQSALMLRVRMTLPHFSVSSAISLPNWAGDPGSGAPPRSASRDFILGSARAALISLLSLTTISPGMF